MQKPQISIIAAMSSVDRVIGTEDGKLPWHIPNDLKNFKKITTGHPIIMGRKTWEMFGGRTLPNRQHFVITRQENYEVPDGVVIVNNLQKAVDLASEIDNNEIFIIGGGEIYKQAIDSNVADKLYLTQISGKFEGSVKFPKSWRYHFPTTIYRNLIPDDKYEVYIELCTHN